MVARLNGAMATTSDSGSSLRLAFRDRFSLAQFDDGGVLLDLKTRSFYRLNRIASHICWALTQLRTVQEVEQELVQSFRLAPGEAARAVGSVFEQLGRENSRDDQNPITFAAVREGFLLCYEGRPILEIDPLGNELRVRALSTLNHREAVTYVSYGVPLSWHSSSSRFFMRQRCSTAIRFLPSPEPAERARQQQHTYLPPTVRSWSRKTCC